MGVDISVDPRPFMEMFIQVVLSLVGSIVNAIIYIVIHHPLETIFTSFTIIGMVFIIMVPRLMR